MSTTTERGYGVEHQAERRRWQTKLDAGETIPCARCGTPINPDPTAWDLGHTDDRTAWTGPECVHCNRSAGAQAKQRADRTTRREWGQW